MIRIVNKCFRKYSMHAGILPLQSLSENEELMRDSVRTFAETIVAPKVREMDEAEKLDAEILKKLFENGLMGIETPKEYGGLGFSFTSAIVAVEELAKIDPSISVVCDVQNTLVNTLIRKYGNSVQKEKYLSKLSQGTVGCFCLSEVSSGSDAFALKTKAVKEGSSFILTGSKMWITNSYEADVFLVFANVDPSKGYKGITCFIVDKNAGVEIGKKESKLGIRASSTCTVNFDGVKVSEDCILGKLGEGYKYAIEILNEGRIGIAAQMIGLAQGAFNQTMPYLFQRKQFNTRIGDFQGMQHQYAQIATEIEAAKLLTYNAARMKEAGMNFVKEAAMAKVYSSQIADKTASKCIEWMGGLGFTRDLPMEKFFRDCKIGSIYEGTSNIQLQTIAKVLSNQYQGFL